MNHGATGQAVLHDAVGEGQALRVGGGNIAACRGRRHTQDIQGQIKIGTSGLKRIDGQTQAVAGEAQIRSQDRYQARCGARHAGRVCDLINRSACHAVVADCGDHPIHPRRNNLGSAVRKIHDGLNKG